MAYDYYPFGLTWHNPAAADTPEGRHDHAYQDKEFQWNEFGAGAGMALYDFHARMNDPATATWSVPDPAEQFSNPYLAMGNNPVVGVDPDGKAVWVVSGAIGALVGGLAGGVLAVQNDQKFWHGFIAGAVVGGAIGIGIGVGIGGLTSTSAVASNGLAIGKSSLGYKIASNAFSNGAINVLSNFHQGKIDNWSDAATYGMVGLAAGALGGWWGGATGNANTFYSLSKSGLFKQNLLTNTISGAFDRYHHSKSSNLPDGEITKNPILGGIEGALTSLMSVDPIITGFRSTTGPTVLGRYISQIGSQIITSMPGMGYSLFMAYMPTALGVHTAPGGAVMNWTAFSTGAWLPHSLFNLFFYRPNDPEMNIPLFRTYPFHPVGQATAYGLMDLYFNLFGN